MRRKISVTPTFFSAIFSSNCLMNKSSLAVSLAAHENWMNVPSGSLISILCKPLSFISAKEIENIALTK
jgi:hypothetical protein